MAAAGSFTKYRSWSTVESEDPNDVGRLYIPESSTEKKIRRTFSTWAFSLIILSLSVMFLVGLLVGYFLIDSQKDECTFGKRRDNLDSHTLNSVHENVMYFISNENVRKLSSDLGLLKERQTEYVKKEFQSYGLDRVEVQEYEVVVTYPDPHRPNQLVVINSTGLVLNNLTLANSRAATQVKDILKNRQDVSQLQPLVVKGELVYGDFGRRMDLTRKNRSVSLKGKVLMVKQGEISVQEKVAEAEWYGVNGLLLYDVDNVEYDVSECEGKDRRYPLPVQRISAVTAKQLLTLYTASNRNITVQLTSNYIQFTKKVRNVVGSIIGDLERDRFVMIGAPRSQYLPQVGTSHMLELARSFKDMQKINGWTPRRSVQFHSWDDDALAHLGINQYLKTQNSVTESSVVGYIDLDILHTGTQSHWLHIMGSDVFYNVLSSVVKEVPDPSNANLVLQDTWDNKLYHGETNIGIQQLGVPTFHPAMAQTQNLTQHTDENHHYMYSLAVSRVASLITLRLLDEKLLPLNMTIYTNSIYNSIIKSVQFITEIQNNNNLINTDVLLEKAEEFRNAVKTFYEYIPGLVKSDDILAIRRINDAIMKSQRILFKIHRSHRPLLQMSDGSLSSITETLSIASLTNDYSQLNCLIKDIVHTLHEAIFCLQSI